jgi:hypothetical protein
MNTTTEKVSPMRQSFARFCALAALAALAPFAFAAAAAAPAAKAFATPDALFQAIADAAKAGDQKALAAIFGPDGARIVSSGDPVRDKNAREHFTAAWAEKHTVNVSGDRAELVVGNDEWPFPVPAVKGAGGWSLDSAAGAREIIARRIGENEIYTIHTVRAIGDAQADYASEPRDGAKDGQYARKFLSSTGRHDGLYWKTKAGEPESPLGPLVAGATREGYGKATPYHGYRYRILTAQGANAKGGARNYVVNGRMIGGFAIVAYPAVYQDTGIMTFMMNQDGVVYQKDLGKHTTELAPKINRYDPDASWTVVDLPDAPKVAAAAATVPGAVGGARVLHVAATITAIDKATREVTLKGPQGNEVVVQAGPDVRNFDAMKVGDAVNVEYVEALTLELHKGSTAPVARVEQGAAARAQPGTQPGGAIGRKITVLAEVMAVDTAANTVTLRGPNRTVVLPVADPAKLKNVAVGDRVEATYTEAVAIAVSPAK